VPSPSPRRPARVLIVYKDLTSFVRDDLEILSGAFEVTPRRLKGRTPSLAQLFQDLRSHDALFCWFASWHSFLPVVVGAWMGLPSLVATGGYDTADLPAISYGHQRGGTRKWVSRAILKRATRLVAASEYSHQEIEAISSELASKVSVIYHGFKPRPVPPLESLRKEPLAITVGSIDRLTLWRKGIAPFVQAGSLLPDIDFYVVGRGERRALEHLRGMASPNVHFTGYLPEADLTALRLRARVYAQPSLHEAFGMAVAESMLHYCIPVVTRAGALPEVVGETGYYCESDRPEDIAQALRSALAAPASRARAARERVLDRFPFERRAEALVSLVEEVLSSRRAGR